MSQESSVPGTYNISFHNSGGYMNVNGVINPRAQFFFDGGGREDIGRDTGTDRPGRPAAIDHDRRPLGSAGERQHLEGVPAPGPERAAEERTPDRLGSDNARPIRNQGQPRPQDQYRPRQQRSKAQARSKIPKAVGRAPYPGRDTFNVRDKYDGHVTARPKRQGGEHVAAQARMVPSSYRVPRFQHANSRRSGRQQNGGRDYIETPRPVRQQHYEREARTPSHGPDHGYGYGHDQSSEDEESYTSEWHSPDHNGRYYVYSDQESDANGQLRGNAPYDSPDSPEDVDALNDFGRAIDPGRFSSKARDYSPKYPVVGTRVEVSDFHDSGFVGSSNVQAATKSDREQRYARHRPEDRELDSFADDAPYRRAPPMPDTSRSRNLGRETDRHHRGEYQSLKHQKHRVDGGKHKEAPRLHRVGTLRGENAPKRVLNEPHHREMQPPIYRDYDYRQDDRDRFRSGTHHLYEQPGEYSGHAPSRNNQEASQAQNPHGRWANPEPIYRVPRPQSRPRATNRYEPGAEQQSQNSERLSLRNEFQIPQYGNGLDYHPQHRKMQSSKNRHQNRVKPASTNDMPFESHQEVFTPFPNGDHRFESSVPDGRHRDGYDGVVAAAFKRIRLQKQGGFISDPVLSGWERCYELDTSGDDSPNFGAKTDCDIDTTAGIACDDLIRDRRSALLSQTVLIIDDPRRQAKKPKKAKTSTKTSAKKRRGLEMLAGKRPFFGGDRAVLDRPHRK